MPSSPPDDDEADPDGEEPRALFSAAFWIALAFGLACVFAGLAFALFGARLFAT